MENWRSLSSQAATPASPTSCACAIDPAPGNVKARMMQTMIAIGLPSRSFTFKFQPSLSPARLIAVAVGVVKGRTPESGRRYPTKEGCAVSLGTPPCGRKKSGAALLQFGQRVVGNLQVFFDDGGGRLVLFDELVDHPVEREVGNRLFEGDETFAHDVVAGHLDVRLRRVAALQPELAGIFFDLRNVLQFFEDLIDDVRILHALRNEPAVEGRVGERPLPAAGRTPRNRNDAELELHVAEIPVVHDGHGDVAVFPGAGFLPVRLVAAFHLVDAFHVDDPLHEFHRFNELRIDRKSTRLNSSHVKISYAVFCLKKKKKTTRPP